MSSLIKKHQSQQMGNAGGLNKDLSGGIVANTTSHDGAFYNFIQLWFGQNELSKRKKRSNSSKAIDANHIMERMYILSHLPDVANQNSFADSVEKKQANESHQLKG